MKKFIKINLIILVIFCLSCNFALIEINATSLEENIEQNDEQVVQENSENNSEENIDENNELIEEQQAEQNSESDEEKDLDTLQLEKSELESNLEQSNSHIQFIENELSATVMEISEINQKIYDKQMEIETLEAQEVDLLAYIEKAEYELTKSNERYDEQKKLLEKRLVAMYEVGQTSYLDLLLSSKGIMEFVSNYFLIQEISIADAELLETVEAEKKYNKKLKENLEAKKIILENSRGTREKNAISLANMAIIKNSRLQQLTEEELEMQQRIEEYQKEITAIETEIRLLALANVSEQYVGGTMAWPVPGYTRITSQFGMRTHPITGVYKLHTGVDIGAPMGAIFVAANDGLVTYAGWNNAYGNMVIVDHGGGITTLYAHGSEILVQAGDTVFQGTPVLKVGSTGYSTGPHAHFEVRIKGEYVQPLDYITSYSTSNNQQIQEDKNESEDKETTTVELDDSQNTEITEEQDTSEN